MKIQALHLKEIAGIYFPNSTPRSANTQIKRWFMYNKALMKALSDAGYVNGQRVFTPKQVQLVFEYLGEP